MTQGPVKTQGRRALVTGGSRGIGAAIAQRLAHDGYRVAIHFRSDPGLAEDVRAALPGADHLLVRADLRDPDQVRSMVDEVAQAWAGLDVLVNNAGIFEAHPIDDTEYDEWQARWAEAIAVNLVGPANATWAAVRHMGPGASIVNVGSRGAFRGEPQCPAYGATKAAISAFGQSLAKDLGRRGIAVTTVAPGFVDTEMAAEAMAGDGGAIRRAESPFGRIASPEEIAAAVAFLASPESAWMSGSILDANGASYLRM